MTGILIYQMVLKCKLKTQVSVYVPTARGRTGARSKCGRLSVTEIDIDGVRKREKGVCCNKGFSRPRHLQGKECNHWPNQTSLGISSL